MSGVDISQEPLSADAGQYDAHCSKAQMMKTKETKKDMLMLEWTLGDSEEHGDSYKGESVTDFIVFHPAEERKAHKQTVLQLRALCAACGIDPKSFPKDLDDDSKQEIERLFHRQNVRLRLTKKEDKNGDVRLRINYKAA